jgi:hypothetical protein
MYNWPYTRPAHEVIVDDVLSDISNETVPADEAWRTALPIPHGVPLPLAPIAYAMRNIRNFHKKGAWHTLRDFYRLKDKRVDALIQNMERAAIENPQPQPLCW